jgi:hypothetical protein
MPPGQDRTEALILIGHGIVSTIVFIAKPSSSVETGWPHAASHCFRGMRRRQVPTNKAQAKPNTYHVVIAGTTGSTA